MERKVKVAVIGIGQMGTYHAEIYQKLPQVELVAICEYNDEKTCRSRTKNFNVRAIKITMIC